MIRSFHGRIGIMIVLIYKFIEDLMEILEKALAVAKVLVYLVVAMKLLGLVLVLGELSKVQDL